ncbi:hypothetical protein CHUAL_001180 [Chamberlinius hualienensis]
MNRLLSCLALAKEIKDKLFHEFVKMIQEPVNHFVGKVQNLIRKIPDVMRKIHDFKISLGSWGIPINILRDFKSTET